MKKKIILSLIQLLFLCAGSFAQQTQFSNYEDAVKNKANVKTLVLSGKTMNFAQKPLNIFPNLEWLEISNCGLTTLPIEVCKIPKLRILKISKNEITKLPDEISALTNLEELYADSNLNMKSLGAGISKLSKLMYLDLANNTSLNLSSELKNIAFLTELRELNISLSGNGNIPIEISALANLRDLAITGRISGGFAGVKVLKNLRGLKLINCDNYDALAPDVIGLTALRRLTISDPYITYIPSEFFKLTELEQITIESPLITDLPSELASLPMLSKLWLTGCTKLKPDSLFESLLTLHALNELRLDKCGIKRLSRKIANLKALTSLDLKQNKISEISSEIKTLTGLKYLNLSGNPLDENIIARLKMKLNACNIVYSSNQNTKKTNNKVINPPLEEQGMFKGTYTSIVEAELGDTLTYPSGSYLIIPKNAFLDSNKEPVIGQVEVTFTDFTSPFDLFLSGIPLTMDTTKKQAVSSAGIIGISATMNNQALSPNPAKPIIAHLVSDDPTEGLNLAFFNEKTGWKKLDSEIQMFNISDIPKPPKQPERFSNIVIPPLPAVQIKRNKEIMIRALKFRYFKDTADIWIDRSVVGKEDVFTVSTEKGELIGKYFPEWQALSSYRWSFMIEGNQVNTKAFRDMINRSVAFGNKYFEAVTLKLRKDKQWFDLTFVTRDRKNKYQLVKLLARPYTKFSNVADSVKRINEKVAKIYSSNYSGRDKLWKQIDSTYDANYINWDFQEENKRHAISSYDANERLKLLAARRYAFEILYKAYKSDSALISDFNTAQFKKQDSIYKASLAKYTIDRDMYLNTQKGRITKEMNQWVDFNLARYDTLSGEYIIVRRFPITNFGLYNCYAKYTIANTIAITNPVFVDSASIMYSAREVFIINFSDRSQEGFYSPLRTFKYNTSAKNGLIVVLNNGNVGYVNFDDFTNAMKNPEEIPIKVLPEKVSINTLRNLILNKLVIE